MAKVTFLLILGLSLTLEVKTLQMKELTVEYPGELFT